MRAIPLCSLLIAIACAYPPAKAFAESANAGPAARPPTEKASHELNFGGDLIEGVNRQPLDSLNEVSEKNGVKEKRYLYKKREHFHDENALTLDEILSGP